MTPVTTKLVSYLAAKCTTNSRHGLQACPNLLLELGQSIRPNQAWVSGTTYQPLLDGD